MHTKTRLMINFGVSVDTQTLSLLTPLSHWLILLFLEVISSANISSCLSFQASQLRFTVSKHCTVCLAGFVVTGKKSLKFKGEDMFGSLYAKLCELSYITGCFLVLFTAELIFCVVV